MRSTVGGIRREATGEFLVNFFLHTPDRHGCSDLTWLAVRDHWSRGESRFLAQVVIKRSNRKTGEVVFGKVVRFESGVTEPNPGVPGKAFMLGRCGVASAKPPIELP